MRLINKYIYYAIRALCYIAEKPDRVVCVSELVGTGKYGNQRCF